MIVQPNHRFHVRPPRQDCRQHPKCCHVITAWGICGSSMLNKTALVTENSWLEATEKWGPAGLGPHDWHICETQVVRQFSHSLDLGWALVFPKNWVFRPISPKVYHHIPCQILYNIRGYDKIQKHQKSRLHHFLWGQHVDTLELDRPYEDVHRCIEA